jgi:hypothetical protein
LTEIEEKKDSGGKKRKSPYSKSSFKMKKKMSLMETVLLNAFGRKETRKLA